MNEDHAIAAELPRNQAWGPGPKREKTCHGSGRPGERENCRNVADTLRSG
jgi:hypothetical protein